MKRTLKKLFAMAVMLCCLFGMSINAFATEVTAVGDCRLSFTLTDKTNGIFIDDLTIKLLNDDTGLEYTYQMTSADYLFGIPVGGNVKQGQYTITLDYASKDGGKFNVQNSDGSAISSFTADTTDHVFNWVVVEVGDAAADSQPTPSGSADDFKVDGAGSDSNIAAGVDLWNEFVSVVEPIETDARYSSILKIIDDTKEDGAKYFAETTGRDKSEYLEMTSFERFLWYAGYIRPYCAVTANYLENLEDWNSKAAGVVNNYLKTYGTEEMSEAYLALMEWQFDYYKGNAAIYNFITGVSSREENAQTEVVPATDPESAETLTPEEQEEVEALMEQEEATTDKGIWSDTIALIKDNIVTLIILLVLVGATVGVVAYRKRKNVDGDIEE